MEETGHGSKMSLGGKEEHSKNPLLAGVGDAVRRQEKRAAEDSGIRASTLQWNSGGHFADAGKRLAKGVLWMLEKLEEERA